MYVKVRLYDYYDLSDPDMVRSHWQRISNRDIHKCSTEVNTGETHILHNNVFVALIYIQII